MGLYQTDWHSFESVYGGSGIDTIEINIPPARIGAEVSLHGVGGGGAIHAGIGHYRRRLSSGADEDVDFPGWFGGPPVIVDFVSSITFTISTGWHQDGYLLARMDYWD